MFNLYCTKKLLERIKPVIEAPRHSRAALGDWYATALFWKPQLALLVNEKTLLPVFMPLAPVATLGQRFPGALAQVLLTLEVSPAFVKAELEKMKEVNYCKTASRSVLGMINQFTYLAEGHKGHFGLTDPLALSLRLANTPCSPLYKGAVFPDKAVKELISAGQMRQEPVWRGKS